MEAYVEANNNQGATVQELKQEVERVKNQLMDVAGLLNDPQRNLSVNTVNQQDIKEWVVNQLNKFSERFDTIENVAKSSDYQKFSLEDLKHE